MRALGVAGAAAGVLIAGAAWAAKPAPVPAGPPSEAQIAARIAKVLAATPLIDGHNDFPWEVRERFAGKVGGFDMRGDLTKAPPAPGQPPGGLVTDIPRLHAGHVGRQVWLVWVPGNGTR